MGLTYELGFIGAGNMAEGIAVGILAKNVLPADKIIASDPNPARRKVFADQLGVTVTDDNARVVAESNTLLLAVKPQTFAEAAAGFADRVQSSQRIISIMAGLSTGKIAAAFQPAAPAVLRVMPNLPIQVGAGVAGVFAGPRATGDDLAFARRVFEAAGQCVTIEDESLMDAVTAVSGSGPAYFYYFVEAITAAGESAGLSYEDALKLAENTCLGAARMMLETNLPPAELRRRVTSPGGTTQAAIEYMESAGVREHIRQAVLAAEKRGRELGNRELGK